MYDLAQPRPILLVEDCAEDARITMRALAQTGVQNHLVLCRDVDEALAYLYRQGVYESLNDADRPELILLDLHLPGRDGLTLLRQIKTDEAMKAIPVIILTTSDALSDIAVCYQYGANSYVKKPNDFTGFIQTITRLVDFWFALTLLPRGNENYA